MKIMMGGKKKAVNAVYFSWVLAAYYAWVLNFPFILDAYRYIHQANGVIYSLLLIFPVCLFLWCIFISLFSLLSIKYIEKIIYIGLTLIASILSYGYIYYHVAFDDYSPLIGVIEQTTWDEISHLANLSFFIWFILFGVLPCVFIAKLRFIHPPFFKELVFKVLGLCIYPLCFFMLILPQLRTVQPMLRLSGLAARVPYQIVPTNFAENVFLHYKTKLTTHLSHKTILDAKLTHKAAGNKPHLLVLVIGETARSMNFQLNGYAKNTNPYTASQGVVSFQHVSACGTATRVSVPCLFSSFSRATFIDFVAAHQDNLLDILTRVGMRSIWVENNETGGCQGVCNRIETVKFEALDEVVIGQLVQQMEKKQGKDSVIVLHLNGSHGPNYHVKYPRKFARFLPDCKKDELRLCDRDALLNAYDNTILYTDYVVAQLIDVLKKEQNNWSSVLIYTSDHGESMGEHGLYGHCAPYAIAPREQTQVPLIVWMSDTFTAEKNISSNCLNNKAQHNDFSHDNIFHSVLGVMDVSTALYKPALDIFKSCRVGSA